MKNKSSFHIATLRALCLSILVSCYGLGLAQDALETEGISAENAEKVSQYFRQYLKFGTEKFKENIPLELTQTEQFQKDIWNLWVQSNVNYSESKLIPLKELNQDNVGKWTLPSRLEPNAILNFFYGRKGNSQKPEAGFPLFIYLHGSGGKYQEWMTGLSICQGFIDAPSVYFIPPKRRRILPLVAKSKAICLGKVAASSFCLR